VATGLRIPITVRNGRLALESGREQTAKVLLLKMSEGESDHPFLQNRALRPALFRTDTASRRALIRRQIELHFADMTRQHRAKLISFSFLPAGEGQVEVRTRYLDIETDKPGEVSPLIQEGS
jgi:hypothetical protein